MKTKNKNNISYNNKNNIYEESLYMARWIALYEAINMIADEAVERKKNFNKIKLSPIRIKQYISSVENHIQKKLIEQETNCIFI